MNDFLYYAPTKVYFGKDKEKEVGSIIKDLGYKIIMLQYGKESIKKSGLYDVVINSLKENGINVVEMGGVEPNPKLDFVNEAIEVARENNVEMILAVGGGSVIDSAKYTAAGVYYDGDVWDFPTKKKTAGKSLPIGCILTISAAGSEMSNSAVISNTKLNMKRGFNSEGNRCKFAICNPELTYTVSPYQTACGIVDIMSHTMERYFSVSADTELTDRIAEGLLKSVINAGKTVMDNPCDYEARATLMWASSLSHNGLTGCGRDEFMPVHQLEHALSGEFDSISHGAGLSVMFPAWARYVYKSNLPRFAQFARRVWNVIEDNDEVAALAGIEKMEGFFQSIGMPLRLSEFGVSKDAICRLAELCTYHKTRTLKYYVDINFDNIVEIYESCY